MCAQQKSLAMSPLSFHMSFLMFKSGTYIKYTENLLLFPPLMVKTYTHHFRVARLKLFLPPRRRLIRIFRAVSLIKRKE